MTDAPIQAPVEVPDDQLIVLDPADADPTIEGTEGLPE